MAAVGGVLVGLGLGVTIGRRGEARRRIERTRIEAAVRANVVPVLEARADELGVPRPKDDVDPVASAVTLAEAIRRHDVRRELPFNDTVSLAARDLNEPSPESLS